MISCLYRKDDIKRLSKGWPGSKDRIHNEAGDFFHQIKDLVKTGYSKKSMLVKYKEDLGRRPFTQSSEERG